MRYVRCKLVLIRFHLFNLEIWLPKNETSNLLIEMVLEYLSRGGANCLQTDA